MKWWQLLFVEISKEMYYLTVEPTLFSSFSVGSICDTIPIDQLFLIKDSWTEQEIFNLIGPIKLSKYCRKSGIKWRRRGK